MADGETFGFTKATAARLVAAMLRVERIFRTTGPGAPTGFGSAQHGYLARTGTGGVPAMSGTTPGQADVTLYEFDGTTLSLGSDTLTAYNMVPAAVGANKVVLLHWANGYPFVVVEPC
jgi:hypothetical protein